jgi:hypothetical protein
MVCNTGRKVWWKIDEFKKLYVLENFYLIQNFLAYQLKNVDDHNKESF